MTFLRQDQTARAILQLSASRSSSNSSAAMNFTITDDYDDVLSRLFTIEDDGRVMIGTARSRQSLGDVADLQEWTLFTDYIMEGFVTYYLRLVKKPDECVLEVRFTGTNRDQYIPCGIRDYIRWAGIEAEQS
jgi:hypothetical protein